MPVFKDRIKDTSTTTGTGTLTLANSAPTGFRTFGAAYGADATVYYTIDGGAEWEVGIGTYTHSATTLARTTIIASSTGSAVNFSAGTKTVFCTVTSQGFAGRQTIWFPAHALIARTTNGPASLTSESSTNKNMITGWDFDASTAEYLQTPPVGMPISYNLGTWTAKILWSHASTTTNFGVAWQVAAVATSDGDAIDAAFGTTQVVTDTGGTTRTQYTTSETSAITVAGSPASGDVIRFQINRAPANGADTMAIDATLEGLWLYFTTNAATDD